MISLKILLMPIKEITVPASKSISNRVLVMAMFNQGSKTLKNVLKCEDTEVMLEIYKQVSLDFEIINETRDSLDLNVSGPAKFEEASFYMNNSGTATRFLIPCLGLIKGKFKLDGCDRMRQRPIADLVNAMRDIGVEIKYLEQDGFLPLEIISNGNLKGVAKIKCDISSQYLSGLLIAQSFCNSFEIEVIGESIVSKGYIDLTKQVIQDFNLNSGYNVESDFSSASYFFALGCLLKDGIKVNNLNPNSLQADKDFLKALTEMGAKIVWSENSVTVSCEKLNPILDYDCENFPDAAMTLAILCAFADGDSKLTGLSTLKFKESDRLSAIQTELAKLGVSSEIDEESITIHGFGTKFNFITAKIETYNDHRIAMCFSLFRFFNPEIEILNPECTAKTYPNYWEDFTYLTS
jgi:3-phosphoshikimate 1-carboxyvinyltransferase